MRCLSFWPCVERDDGQDKLEGRLLPNLGCKSFLWWGHSSMKKIEKCTFSRIQNAIFASKATSQIKGLFKLSNDFRISQIITVDDCVRETNDIWQGESSPDRSSNE